MMQLLQIIYFYVIVAFSFPTPLAVAAGNPIIISSSINSLPFNVSVEFSVPRNNNNNNNPQGGSDADAYALRLDYYSAFSGTGWNYARLIPKSDVGNVFEFKNNKLIPLGGSAPAALVIRSRAGGFGFSGLRFIVFDVFFRERKR